MNNDEMASETTVEKPSELPQLTAEPLQPEPAAVDPALLEAQKAASENWDRFVRAQAEMENLRRRMEKDLQNAHKYALEKFVKELLPVVDSLELGIAAASAESPDIAKLREGNELTLKQLQSVLEKFNIRAIDPVGEKFNPELHQAMAMEPSSSAEPNTVLRVFQKGYLLNDRLLRPSLVVVAQAVAEPAKTDERA
ncbi:MAG TPA: nucleotide exchange factor GrpE [Methylococcus sp.]|nr:nucleotide exchange factor GrpE [Methylococcus sp.]